MVVGRDGRIVDVGSTLELDAKYANASVDVDVDATGKCILPGTVSSILNQCMRAHTAQSHNLCFPVWSSGFVDGHTHPVWSGDRVHEFAMKLAGATYMDIHKKGGGIGFTVRHTRESSEEELRALFIARLNRMLRFGTYVSHNNIGRLFLADFSNECACFQQSQFALYLVSHQHSA